VEDGLDHGQVEGHGVGFHHGKDQDGGLEEEHGGYSLHPTLWEPTDIPVTQLGIDHHSGMGILPTTNKTSWGGVG